MKSEITTLEQLKSSVKKMKPLFLEHSIFLLSGVMGAGKTEFVKTVVSVLHESKEVSSPTFALHHNYSTRAPIIEHWDLYRLNSEEELESSGFWDQFLDPKKLIFIEWAERLNRSELPLGWNIYELSFELKSEKRFMNFKKL